MSAFGDKSICLNVGSGIQTSRKEGVGDPGNYRTQHNAYSYFPTFGTAPNPNASACGSFCTRCPPSTATGEDMAGFSAQALTRRYSGKPPRRNRRYGFKHGPRLQAKLDKGPYARTYSTFLPQGAFAGGKGGQGKGNSGGLAEAQVH